MRFSFRVRSPVREGVKCAAFGNKWAALGPIHRLLAKGLNDDDIVMKLDQTEAKVRGCIAWTFHFLS